mmetsp:Transcript_6254/g.7605  ORF Transcript_6254/g.7605 Transcript_6254/m.7605 type:complete len:194 (-) Transcript_6254:246-827(-)
MFGYYCRQRNWHRPPNPQDVYKAESANAASSNQWLASRQEMQHKKGAAGKIRETKQAILYVPGNFNTNSQRGEKRAPGDRINVLCKRYKKESQNQAPSGGCNADFDLRMNDTDMVDVGTTNPSNSRNETCIMHGEMHCGMECKSDVKMDDVEWNVEQVRSQANTEHFPPVSRHQNKFAPDFELLGSGFDIYDR